jgi:hypothetical protein
MSLLFAALWVVGVSLGHLAAHALYPNSSRWLTLDMGDGTALVSVLLSLALFAYTRGADRTRFVLIWALVYLVAIARSRCAHFTSPACRAVRW